MPGKKLICLLVAVAVLVACAPEPETIVETVIEEVEVTRVVEVAGETTVETVVEQVVVTATPAPVTEGRGSCGTLRLLWWQAPTILNPHLAIGSKDWDAARLVYEPLAALNEKGEPDVRYGLGAEVPTLENGGISPDGLSITWKLKQGVQWSDGTPFTADDVVFTWQYVTDEATGSTSYAKMQNIETVEKIDDHTVKITWKQLNPTPYSAFTGVFGMIIQKEAFESYMGEAAMNAPANLMPVGTGPYVVKEFKPGDMVSYEANPNFRDPNKPCFQEVVFKGGGDATSAARAVLQTGDADYAGNVQVTADVLQELLAEGKGELVGARGASVERIIINFTNPDPALGDERSEPDHPHPFLTDLRVRQALALAVDRQTIATQLYGDGLTGVATCNILPAPPAIASTTRFDTCEFNLEEANNLLDEAGWVRGADGIRQKVIDGETVNMKILFQTSVNPVRQKTQEIVKQGWEQLGIEVELKAIQAGVFFSTDVANPDTLSKFYADVEMFGNNPSAPDDPAYMAIWSCAEIKTREANWSGRNNSRWCNTDYEELLDKLRNTIDPAERAVLYKQMNDMLASEVVEIPLVNKIQPIGARSNALNGVVLSPWDNETWNILDWTK